LIITISILLSQVLGMGSVLGNEAGWPFLLGLTIIPGILQVNPVKNRSEPVLKQVFLLNTGFETESSLKLIRSKTSFGTSTYSAYCSCR
jgi:hypothetical protein